MRSLSLITIILIAAIIVLAFRPDDPPHGNNFDLSCSLCHNSESWKMAKDHNFRHDSLTQFPLLGQHSAINCRQCHVSLVFSEASMECVSCHADMHKQSVGMDCGRCHTPESWLVTNIIEIHQQGRFPLVGPHLAAQCQDCHQSASSLYFEPLGIECVDCHLEDYNSATNPNHIEAGYSTECTECHNMNAFTWSGAGINHNFFPLTKGHEISDCFACHTPGTDYSNISRECFSCHQPDYESATNPSHQEAQFSTNCSECHTTDPGWKPAKFTEHDGLYFPIYSGEHQGTWDECLECHTDPSNYTLFTCIDCHEHNQPDMDEEHDDVGGYIYASPECYACHPTGDADDSFNHNLTSFPLTGAHMTTDCSQCHATGYAGTPVDCFSCHEPDYNATQDPIHSDLELSVICEDCHTTEPGWSPASFDVHDEYYPLTGAHISTSCALCHIDGYSGTPDYCFACHEADYNNSANPIHPNLDLSTACDECHTTNTDWKPASFDIHNEYYDLIGAHSLIANNCASCHNGDYNNTPNTCVGCHLDDYNQTNDPPHESAQFPTDCEFCHNQVAWEPSTFDHDNMYFPIYSGEHQGEWNECIDCHTNPANYTIFSCIDCHEHNQAEMDSEHEDVSGYVYNSMACYECHPDGGESMFIKFRKTKVDNNDIKY